MIFSTVFGPHEPALTVGSLAITATGRPSTSPMPVTTPSAPRPSWSQLASSASSANEPVVEQQREALAHRQLALLGAFSWWRSGPPASARASRRRSLGGSLTRGRCHQTVLSRSICGFGTGSSPDQS